MDEGQTQVLPGTAERLQGHPGRARLWATCKRTCLPRQTDRDKAYSPGKVPSQGASPGLSIWWRGGPAERPVHSGVEGLKPQILCSLKGRSRINSQKSAREHYSRGRCSNTPENPGFTKKKLLCRRILANKQIKPKNEKSNKSAKHATICKTSCTCCFNFESQSKDPKP